MFISIDLPFNMLDWHHNLQNIKMQFN